jgi:hypothetical protein
MATTTEVHAGELVPSKGATSGIGRNFRNHRTLCVGSLYLITIIVVLALVARL